MNNAREFDFEIPFFLLLRLRCLEFKFLGLIELESCAFMFGAHFMVSPFGREGEGERGRIRRIIQGAKTGMGSNIVTVA